MRLKCLGCEVLARAIYQCAALSPHIVDVELIRHGLHDHPLDLRKQLQERIDATASEHYDAVVLGYGLCGQAIAGLTANQHPLVVPRAHDCITLFLGSRQRYRDQFDNQPGTYWYAVDYIERRDSAEPTVGLGSTSDEDLEVTYAKYLQKFGKDNADYLMEVMGAWKKHYQRAVFIDMGIGAGSVVESRAKADADRRGWVFERMAGNLVLIRGLLDGTWGSDFLVVQPTQQITITYDENIIECVFTGA